MKSQVADRSVSVPMTLNDLESREERGQLFPADLKNTNKIKKIHSCRSTYTEQPNTVR